MSAEELEELEELIENEEENNKEEDSIVAIPSSEAKRLQLLQEDFIAKHKKVQIAECVFVYEKIDE